MMAYLKNLKIKTKFMILGSILLFVVFLCIWGMLEIAKITQIQKLERDHIEFSTFLEFRGKEYINLLEKGTAEAVSRADTLLNARAKTSKEMGIFQLLEEALKQPRRLFEVTNWFEENLFTWLGFGTAFELAVKDIKDCEEVKKALDQFQEKRININDFKDRFLHYVGELQENGRIFTPIVNRASVLLQ